MLSSESSANMTCVAEVDCGMTENFLGCFVASEIVLPLRMWKVLFSKKNSISTWKSEFDFTFIFRLVTSECKTVFFLVIFKVFGCFSVIVSSVC